MAGAAPRDVALLLLLGTLWGISFTAIKAGLAAVDPIFFAAVRYDIAAVVMLIVAAAAFGRRLLPRGRQWVAVLVAGALNVMGYHAFLYWGQQYTTAGVAAVIIGLNPIMAMVAARALLPGERVGPWGVLGLVLGLAGLATLIGLKPGEVLDARGVGEMIVFGAVLSWGFGSVLVKRAAHGMPVVPFTAAQMTVGALLLHGASLVLEGPRPRAQWELHSLVSLLYLALVGSGLGFLIYFTLLERIGPIRSSLVSYIAPAAATLSGLLLLHEPLEARMVIAFVLILAGFRLVIRPAPPRPGTTAPLTPGPGAVARPATRPDAPRKGGP